MENMIKCPKCQGQSCEHLNGNLYKCQYCGEIFEAQDSNVCQQPYQQRQYPQQPMQQPYQQRQYPQQPIQQQNQQRQYSQQPYQQQYPNQMVENVGTKNKTTAAILAILVGFLGIHKFYLRRYAAGILYLLFCWTGIPAILAFIDFIIYLTMSDYDFNYKYNSI